jgi:hypothetical protein
VAVGRLAVFGVQSPAAEGPALRDDHPVGSRGGTSTSAVTVCGLFFTLIIEASVRRPMPPNSSCELASDITCVSGRLMLQPPQPVGPRRRLGQQNRQLVAGLGTPAPVHLSADSPAFLACWGLGPGSETTLRLL